MTKLIVFDSVNLKTAILARQILDANPDVWIFMIGEVGHNKQPVMFKNDDNMSWVLNFCDLRTVTLNQFNDDPISVCIPDVAQDVLIDRILNKHNLSLTSDTPITIDLDARTVRLDDTVGYSFVPFGDIRTIFVDTPIDKFYDFKFGHLMYRNKPCVDTRTLKTQFATTSEIELCTDLNAGKINSKVIWCRSDECGVYTNLVFDLAYANELNYAVDTIDPTNINLFNKYIAHNKTNSQIKYIGPDITRWPTNPFLLDITTLSDTIRKI